MERFDFKIRSQNWFNNFPLFIRKENIHLTTSKKSFQIQHDNNRKFFLKRCELLLKNL